MGPKAFSPSSDGEGSSKTSPPDMRVSISMTSSRLTLSFCATVSISWALSVSRFVFSSSAAASALRPCFIERRLKNSLRWALVVASLTMRQFLRMYSWISALIQCMA
ncbi:hypothetical protein D3C78_1701160 [compost metagenome]